MFTHDLGRHHHSIDNTDQFVTIFCGICKRKLDHNNAIH